jgi:signal transduction histidine kinase
VPGKAAGQAAVELPWLCPTTDGLIALADDPSATAGLSAADPALSVFLLRFAQPAAEPDHIVFVPGSLHAARLPETAAAYLAATRRGVLPASSSALGRVRSAAGLAGEFAASLAVETRLVPPAAAAAVARLTPLGWFAVAAADPCAAADPLADPRFADRPADVLRDVWGLDHAAIARRLAGRWRLPAWVATTVGYLSLPFGVARHLVTNPDLFAVVQLAVLEVEVRQGGLGLTHGAGRGELLDHLGLRARGVDAILDRVPLPNPPAATAHDPDPHKVPLVRHLLRLAAESRRRNGPALVASLEDRIDDLARAAADLGNLAGDRLRDAKLDALAELAAGAAHEINNPLAVISGNAQRLLRTEADPDRGDSLRAIVRQADRIAGILRDLMQFARPPRPETRPFPAAELVRGVCEELAGFATDRRVRLEPGPVAPDLLWADGDRKQLYHALVAVVRNGVEAAGPDGWVRVSVTPEYGPPAIVVEDGGPGLIGEAAEHAFDPFYCGRTAGRGRGLGLPTAWQLVRQNGGELRHEPVPGGPTRFVLTLRRAVGGDDVLSLRSA